MWYNFRQNNSGGSFHEDEESGIGINVIIEADSESHAWDRAESIGLYFNGCSDGRDCECCGDRWYRYCESSVDPMIWDNFVTHGFGDGSDAHMDWEHKSYIHPIDGNFSYVVLVEKEND